jgi:hypothetical protein
LSSGTGLVRLLPGTYAVRISLNDRSAPGFETTGFVVRNEDVRQTKEFRVPDSYRTLSGIVVNALSTSAPIEGVLVEAIGKRSGLPSTQAITDATGAYSIQLPDTPETQFLLTARVANAVATDWSFQEEVRVDASIREKLIELEQVDDARRGCLKLQIFGKGNVPEPIANANVTLTASTTAGLETRRYSISGVTNSDGLMVVQNPGTCVDSVPFLDEHYLVEVQTPQQSPFASTKSVLELEGQADEQVLLELRTRVAGIVVSASNRPVADALLELLPLDERARTFDAETGPDGSFVADVDPGLYLVVIRPPQLQSGELLPVHTVVQEIAEAGQVELGTIELPEGTEVFGAVRGQQPGGQSVAMERARVEFFVHQQTQTISIARTFTDSAGSYSVVLPNLAN